MSAEKRSISAPADLFARADVRRKELGYDKFSDYIQHLIRADVMHGGAHIREASPDYQVSSSPGLTAAGKILGAAADIARNEATERQPPAKPIKYTTGRRSKKQPHT